MFARGTAEQVTDPALTAEPLKHPGEVIRVSRGDLKAQLKALGPKKPASPKKARLAPEATPEPPKKPAGSRPPPKRDKVDRAEAALATARDRQAKERGTLEREREAIERKLEALTARQAKEIARLQDRLETAQADYRAALEAWSG